MANAFCWINGTYSTRSLAVDAMRHEVAHPGMGPHDMRSATAMDNDSVNAQ